MSDVKVLLRYALLSITESARRLIFYNICSIINYSSCQDYTVSCMYGQQQQQRQQNSSPETETNAAIIIDEAEKLFYNVQSDNESSSLSLPPGKELSDVQKDSTQKLAAYTYRKEEHTYLFNQIPSQRKTALFTALTSRRAFSTTRDSEVIFDA